ncbi:hypothetical protein [Thermodesulforhabdus norvegica]|uniref:Uncharacterized protein n=1 Tax=Thermodesulforhabdus norvegica TaxID=39841 RepID=A0A1I4QKS0_9BACT|nr:hypothetical protein [Thermodesulforhabdus norvegica]SFM40624.1 hypothetical protein SAMN05660836_00088 [Thermodesulforhabdus norvegica]
MRERFDWVKNISFESNGRDVYTASEAPAGENVTGVAPEEEKKGKDRSIDREAWLEQWMEDVKRFIRNIDVNSL